MIIRKDLIIGEPMIRIYRKQFNIENEMSETKMSEMLGFYRTYPGGCSVGGLLFDVTLARSLRVPLIIERSHQFLLLVRQTVTVRVVEIVHRKLIGQLLDPVLLAGFSFVAGFVLGYRVQELRHLNEQRE